MARQSGNNTLSTHQSTQTTAVVPAQSASSSANAELVSQSNNVWRDGNHIFFHAEVDREPATYLLKDLRQLEYDMLADRLAFTYPEGHPPVPIFLHINSFGGYANEAMMLVDAIQSLRVPVHSIIEGSAMSAATLISSACVRRYIRPNAYTMIHQANGGVWGTYEQMVAGMTHMEKLMESIVDLYAVTTGATKKAIRKILKTDTYMTAQETIDFGLCHEIWKG